jgi:hypothetical protein
MNSDLADPEQRLIDTTVSSALLGIGIALLPTDLEQRVSFRLFSVLIEKLDSAINTESAVVDLRKILGAIEIVLDTSSIGMRERENIREVPNTSDKKQQKPFSAITSRWKALFNQGLLSDKMVTRLGHCVSKSWHNTFISASWLLKPNNAMAFSGQLAEKSGLYHFLCQRCRDAMHGDLITEIINATPKDSSGSDLQCSFCLAVKAIALDWNLLPSSRIF